MQKPAKTFADYLVIAIIPVLIMLLVGSLAFFLVQVFYPSEMIPGVRWVMFWFVMAIVLVARIGIEQSKEHAAVYGVALAIVTWIYLIYMHATVLTVFWGLILLAVTWFCAHKLTIDCTLIKEDEDASGEGVWEGLWRALEMSLEPPGRIGGPSQRWIKPTTTNQPTTPTKFLPLPKGEGRGEGEVPPHFPETHGRPGQTSGRPPLPPLPAGVPLPKRRKPARAPGRWVVYFSVLALPLFGAGQLFLPADPEARRTGFEFLLLYLAAALSLLMTTSFLGMRRYLRQRFVEMSAPIAAGWVRFGVLLTSAVLFLALVLPRPGATSTWHKITNHIKYKQHHASPYAFVFNAPGEGNGSPSDQPAEHTAPGTDSHHGTSGGGNQNAQNQGNQSTTQGNSGQSGNAGSGGHSGHGQGSGGGAGSGSSGGNAGSAGSGNGSGNSAGSANASTPQGSGKNPGGNNSPNANNPGNGNGGSGGYDDGKDPEPPNGKFQHGSGADDSQTEKRPQNQTAPDEQPAQQPGQKPGGGNGPQGGNGNVQNGSGPSGNQSQPKPTPTQKPNVPQQQQPTPQPQQKPGPKTPHQFDWQRLLLILFLIAIAALFVWLVVRYRRAIAQAFRSFVAAVRDFFQKLFSLRRRKRPAAEQIPLAAAPPQPFSTFENPFLSSKATSWPPRRLIFYTYEAIRGWAKDQRIEVKPQETPREFCTRLCRHFPDFAPDLERFSCFYSYAAFADELPKDYDEEPIHFLWTYMGDSVIAISSR